MAAHSSSEPKSQRGVEEPLGADSRTSDVVFREISDLRLRYEQTTDPDQKQRLETELREMRRRNAKRADAGVSSLRFDQLRSAERRVTRELKTMADRRTILVNAGGGDERGSGSDVNQIIENNQRVDRQGGRASLEKELLEISAELIKRRTQP